jgi:group I intron endonuclease
MKQIGIYKITSPTGRVYIGQSVNIERRFNTYEKLNCKQQIRLYNSFLKYGIENHVFEIIELCEEKELNKRERFFQEKFNVLEKGLNCKLTKTKDRSGKLSEETKKKLSELQKGRKRTIEQKKQISKTLKGNTPWNKGKKGLQKVWNKGKKGLQKHSEETKQKMSEQRKGEKNKSSKLVLNLETGIYYFGTRLAAESLNIKTTTLKAKLRGQNKNNTSFIHV